LEKKPTSSALAMSGTLNDFRNFMLRGHIITYIIGVCVGASYVTLVSAIVKHLFMPLIFHCLLNDETNIAKRKIILRAQKCGADKCVVQDEIAIGYGSIIEALINFAIISTSVYVVLRVIGHLSKRNLLSDEASTTPTHETRTEALLAKTSTLLERQGQAQADALAAQASR
jgi:large conductance mechanosensitive channel